MATYIPVTNIPEQFFDNAGDPLTGGTLEFYLAGTTTATDLFTSDGTSIGDSITLNSWGYPESGGSLITLFRDQSKAIKLVLKNSAGATIWTADNIPATAAFDSTSSAKLDLITVTSAVNLDTLAAGSYLPLAGGTMTGGLILGAGALLRRSVSAGVIASTTQTQAGGTALVSDVNEVTTVANANDAVTLPTAVAGYEIVVINNGASALQVFPAADDSIDSGAVDISVTIPSGSAMVFTAQSSVVWNTTAHFAHGTILHPIIRAAAADAVTDTAACSVANYYTTLTTTGAAVPTLADGYEGQLKKIQMIVDSGAATLTPANLAGGTTITFADVGDTAELIFSQGEWVAIALYNVADGATAPVLA